MADYQRDSGEPEAVRRQDGGGETSPLPGSEAARGNQSPTNGAAGIGVGPETWTPGEGESGVRPGSTAEAATAGAASAQAAAERANDPQDD